MCFLRQLNARSFSRNKECRSHLEVWRLCLGKQRLLKGFRGHSGEPTKEKLPEHVSRHLVLPSDTGVLGGDINCIQFYHTLLTKVLKN